MIAAASKAAVARRKSYNADHRNDRLSASPMPHREDRESEPMSSNESINEGRLGGSIERLKEESSVSMENLSHIRQSINFRLEQMSALYKTELPYQNEVRAAYMGSFIQIAVAALIFLNFLVSAASSQYGKDPPQVFIIFDLIFTITFSLELLMNMYAHWIWAFWRSNWNIFDFLIVVISLVSLSVPPSVDIPGLTVLRLFRAFRVFRLFKRVQSLKLIIEGVIKSLPGVFNAFGILVLLMGIWAIMGVELFSEKDPNFATFGKSMLTLFQILTLDGWMDILDGTDEKVGLMESNGYVAPLIFFMTYIFIASIVMVNVVIAVLIENFLSRDDGSDDNQIHDGIDCRLSEPNKNRFSETRKMQVKISHFSDDLVPKEVQPLVIKRQNIISKLNNLKLDPKNFAAFAILQDMEEMITELDEQERKEVKDFLH